VNVGFVVIGRNEGERLKKCLQIVVGYAGQVVYVDSGSTDGSVDMARIMRVEVVELDMRIPFTAARARNEGFRRLRSLATDLAYVQFVDGDCELAQGWLGHAAVFLDDHEDVAVACGRLREKFPMKSVYNALIDFELDTPVGEAKACGGIAMIRVSAFERVQGFRVDLIAGEEPELCVRLRASGWRIWRLDAEMGLHDAAMLHFGQWWNRMRRCGYAFAQGADLHGASPERHCVRESRSALFWGLGLPLFAFLCTAVIGSVGLAAFAIYPLQVARLALRGNRTMRENWSHAFFLVIGKFPEMLGQLKFLVLHHLGRESRLIEYK
jgi:cellulose synthase/poly-beta-1,6-N-acetylglucosamine synthase-like glycosyltransferase